MNLASCTVCSSILDEEDNFCRRCGASTSAERLPAVRGPISAAIWQPRVPPVVKGAAVMAAGTVGQYLVRRVVTNMLGGGARPRPSRALRKREGDGMTDEAQIITETVMMRRVRIRRPT